MRLFVTMQNCVFLKKKKKEVRVWGKMYEYLVGVYLLCSQQSKFDCEQ